MTLDETAVDTQSTRELGRLSHHQCRGTWAVAHTHPQAELWANHCLQQRGYTTFLPLYAVQLRDRALPTLIRTALKPLFPRYLFVNHPNPDLWRPIRETPGVHSVLKSGNRIQYARAGAVEALQATEALRATIPHPRHQMAVGDAVKPLAGPFKGYPAVLVEIGRQTARVSIMLLGELRDVSLALKNLQPQND